MDLPGPAPHRPAPPRATLFTDREQKDTDVVERSGEERRARRSFRPYLVFFSSAFSGSFFLGISAFTLSITIAFTMS